MLVRGTKGCGSRWGIEVVDADTESLCAISGPSEEWRAAHPLEAHDPYGDFDPEERLAHHLTRVAIRTKELAEHCAPILAEAELHEDWLRALGADTEPQFHEFLDSDDRKLRAWLADSAKRSQAMTTVRREIRQRRDD